MVNGPITEAEWRSWYANQERRYTFGGDFPDEPPSTLTYRTAHRYVIKARGKASAHLCAGHSGCHCGNQASEWSYDHNDPEPLIAKGCEYSSRIECYSARCKACHQAIDRSPGDRMGSNYRG